MIQKQIFIYGVFSFIFTSLHALTLQESVSEAISTNPVIQERLKNYRATQQDLNVAESEFYPQLDLKASTGRTRQGNIKNNASSDWHHNIAKNSYGTYDTSLVLTQNIFEGFSTLNKIDAQEARILAAAYNYIERANDITLKMTTAYLNVLRSYDLLENAKQNVAINEDIFLKVKDLFDAGLTTDSEVKKIESTLSLARSNLTVQKGNTQASEYSFRGVLGRMPDVAMLQKPASDVAMPENLEKAALYAINHNPSLLVSNYNIKGAESLYKQNKKEYYPKIDLEVSQNYRDYERGPALEIADDRFQAKVVMSYNLFRGGADSATVQKHVSLINQEVEIKRELKRQVIESIDLSWNSYEMINLQLRDLRDYSYFSLKTLELFKEEYNLGRRSLLDLLFAQNDVINSNAQIINAEYDHLLAKYRILDAMGLLPLALLGDTKEFSAKVNLYTDAKASEVLDTVPVKFDADNDNIVDNQDLCDNSLLENNIMSQGCVEKVLYDDNSKSDKFEAIYRFDMIVFQGNEIEKSSQVIVKNVIKKVQGLQEEAKSFSITLVGHTEQTTDNKNEKSIKSDIYISSAANMLKNNLSNDESLRLSQSYIDNLKVKLLSAGLLEEQIFSEARGGKDKIFTEIYKADKKASNGVFLTIYVDKKIELQSKEEVEVSPKVKIQKILNETPKKLAKVPESIIVAKRPKESLIKERLKLKFETKSDKFLQSSYGEIERFAIFLKEHPEYHAKIIGHTDSTGEEMPNMTLSVKQALMVKRALVERGIDSFRLSTEGRGELEPIESNILKAGREINRRIEVELFIQK